MTLRTLLILPFIICLAFAQRAHAQDDSPEQSDGPYWSTVFQGGVLVPLGDMTTDHQRSLAGGLRIGWTSASGLGVDLTAEYSPISRKPGEADVRFDTHFVTAGLMPRFTLGKKRVRLWLAGGLGLAFDRTKQFQGMDFVDSDNQIAASGMGAAGVELHPFSGVGLAVVGTYTHTVGAFQYQLFNVTGGLAFTFR